MEDYGTIGVMVSVFGALAAAVARVRSFEKSIIDEVDRRIDDAFKKMDSKLEVKADMIAAMKIEQSVERLSGDVGNLASSVSDFIRRQDEHIKTLYDQDHALAEQVSNLRVEVARKHG